MTKIIAPFFLCVAGCAAPSSKLATPPLAAGPQKTFEAALSPECRTFIKSLPIDVTHGFLELPADWRAPEGRQVRLFYYVQQDEKDLGSRTPVLLLNGAPGESSWGLFSGIEARLGEVKEPVVFMDHRGTGCSTTFSEAHGAGPDALSQFSSRQIVMDAEAVREHLFGAKTKWSVYGHSFGSLVVHRYVAVRPESLKKAFAHNFSVLGEEGLYRERERRFQLQNLRAYFKARPGDKKLIREWLAKNKIEKCQPSAAVDCVALVPEAMLRRMADRSQWDRVHNHIKGLVSATPVPQVAPTVKADRQEEKGIQAITAVDYLNENFPSEDPFRCREADRQLRAEVSQVESVFLQPCEQYGAWAPSFFAGLRAHADPLRLQDVKSSLQRFPKLEFHLYAGALDTVAPPTYFTDAVKALGKRIQFRTLEKTAHQTLAEVPAVWRDVFRQ